MRPKNSSLIRDAIHDQINDYRCGIRYANQFARQGNARKEAEETDYAFSCRAKAIEWFKRRHGMRVNQYGFPV